MSMKIRLKKYLLDIAVIMGLIAAITMTVGVAAALGAILSIIFGGNSVYWAIGTGIVDILACVWLVRKLVLDYEKDYMSQMP